jgi:signal transduction histidine kinase/CheY-like chemotaxis protein/HAMP domain-containing protein
VANGDLKRKLTVEAKGEIAELAETINEMTDTLATFADQVTTVAREVGVEGQLGGQAKVPGAAGTWKALTENVNQLAANLTTQVRAIAEVATAVTKGDLTRSITVGAQGEVAALKDTINEMIRNLRDTTQKNTEQDWLKTNLAKFSRMLQGQRDLTNVGRMVLSELCPVVNARQAEIYVLDSTDRQPQLRLLASYATEGKELQDKRFALGEGVIGQCAVEKEKVELNNVPPDYFRISSGLGGASPRSILVLPLVFEGQVRGVLELASFQGFNPTHQAFLDQLTESIGIVLNTIEANMRTEDLLKQSQSLAQQLQTRQEELQKTNEALQEKAHLLARQNEEVERKNAEVEQARQELEEKARQLALTSKYKSEFLANMSHELRTPLNSLLILSDQLSKNPGGNLTPKQTEFAKTIHSSGNDLLNLINDILDLSKIESGTVQVDVGELRLDDMRRFVERTFRHVAESKSVEFSINFDSQLPPAMQTDAKRLQQIIKNLLSNAFKFTHRGSVSLSVFSACDGWSAEHEVLGHAPYVLAFEVADTGIGISTDKQHIIFEAFQQADGSTSRKYGGTGLGLAISRELSRLLGGEIKLVSNPGAGSTFTLYVPQNYSASRPPRKGQLAESVLVGAAKSPALLEAGRAIAPPAARQRSAGTSRTSDRRRQRAVAGVASPHPAETLPVNEANDDRDTIQPGDRVLLIVENDMRFAGVLLDAARQQGLKGLVATRGVAALALARDYSPQAVTLDIFLPDIDGWRVLERLKGNLATRHLPVCVISTDEARRRALASGAIAFLAKPIQSRQTIDNLLKHLHDFVSRTSRQVLVVEPDAGRRETITRLAATDDVRVIVAATEEEALEALEREHPDCLVVNPGLASLAARLASLQSVEGDVLSSLPVIVYGESPAGDGQWNRLAESCTVRCATSTEQLADLLVLFTHRTLGDLPEDQRQMLAALHDGDRVLAGKKALIVDDDMRNIFALTTVLEEHAMETLSADNGRDAIELLKATSGIDIVLMDIMMPELDGIETIRIIRRDENLKALPIVAVTAKAMKGDREKCIEAGAWDYLAKPVDTEQLLAVLRAWLRD